MHTNTHIHTHIYMYLSSQIDHNVMSTTCFHLRYLTLIQKYIYIPFYGCIVFYYTSMQ